jgi:multiple antibiotic resistance protein
MQDPSLLNMTVGLFAMTGPIAGIPIFITATRGQKTKDRHATTLIIALTYVIATFIALFAGNALLKFFGISVAALRVAGMSVIATIGWKMMNAPTASGRGDNNRTGDEMGGKTAMAMHRHTASNVKIHPFTQHVPLPSEIGIMPLGFPIYAGPGVLSVIISWSSNSSEVYENACFAIFINAALIILFNFLAQPISRIVGVQGLLITEKIFGLIILAIAVVGMASALVVLFPGLGNSGK